MYDHTYTCQIRHQATHKMGCQPGVCMWSLQYSSGVQVGIYGLTYSLMTPEGCSSTTIPGPPTFGLNTHLHSLHALNIAVYVCSHRVEDTAHFFLDCPLNVQRMALRNTVTKFRHFRLEAYGDDNLNCETIVAVLLAGHEFIMRHRNNERLLYLL